MYKVLKITLKYFEIYATDTQIMGRNLILIN